MEDGLSSNGIWLKAIDAPSAAPATIVLDDQGRGNSAVYAADRLNRGEQVLAVDLPFNGESWHKDTAWMFRADLAAGAEPVRDRRPAPWHRSGPFDRAGELVEASGAGQIRLETTGIRNQVVALVASALNPSLFSEILIHGGMASLRYLVDKHVKYAEAPDLFCLDLYKFTDLDRLAALSAPTTVKYPLPTAQP
jgi:hypothetical protein